MVTTVTSHLGSQKKTSCLSEVVVSRQLHELDNCLYAASLLLTAFDVYEGMSSSIDSPLFPSCDIYPVSSSQRRLLWLFAVREYFCSVAITSIGVHVPTRLQCSSTKSAISTGTSVRRAASNTVEGQLPVAETKAVGI